MSGFGILLMRQFMSRLPDALCEAARIDGCSELGTRLILEGDSAVRVFNLYPVCAPM